MSNESLHQGELPSMKVQEVRVPFQSTQHTAKIAFDQFSVFVAVHRNPDTDVAAAQPPQSDVEYLAVVSPSPCDDLDRAQTQTVHGDLVAPPHRRRGPLLKWRLKRVVEYVDAHLGGRITLASMAAAAGLTPMHFAAQFRSATGLRPHDYVLQRRIERARELLRDPRRALLDVALSVGFQTQAHFTTVFKRFVGAPPHRWRRLMSAQPSLEQAGRSDPGRLCRVP